MTDTIPYLWLRAARGKQIAYHRKHGNARRVRGDPGFAGALSRTVRSVGPHWSAPRIA